MRQGPGAMTIIGYARVSTTDQDLSIQQAALKAAGCEVIRAEKRSGTSTRGREELRTVLDFLRKGFRRTQGPRLVEASQASTARRLAGALRFKPLCYQRRELHLKSAV